MAGFTYLNGFNTSYSDRYNALQQQHVEQLREEILGQKEDVMSKNRKLSAETNKRRRELVNKKKARESEEEKRRNEILAERRARIQDVTQKYQRGSPNKSQSHQANKPHRARRAVSAPVSRPKQINLEDALRNIRGSNQFQYNAGDSGLQFLQKYGAHRSSNSNSNIQHETNDATMIHSQSVKDIHNHSKSLFEQQLLNHQAMLSHNQVEVPGNHVYKDINSTTNNDDTQSIESLDSLESEQPSFRSHLINSNQRTLSNGANRSKQTLDNASAGSRVNGVGNSDNGGGTYRQDAPMVLNNNNNNSTIHNKLINGLTVNSHQYHQVPNHQQQDKPPSQQQSTKTTATSIVNLDPFIGFQVVNTNNKVAMKNSNTEGHISESITDNLRAKSHQPDNDHSDKNAFYLKSRSESQCKIQSFPPYAWGTRSIEEPTNVNNYVSDNHPPVDLMTDDVINETANNFIPLNDTISDTASDSGGPRSILKKRNTNNATLPRSQSTPSIRDSVEVAKAHMKGTAKPETPKSAKKSVRFSEEKCQPVFYQKGSSPSNISSGIPRPVQSKRNISTETNVPHIHESLTPNKKAGGSKPPSSSAKGPVIAKHNIPLTNNKADDIGRDLAHIRLDKTPTDDEIEILWEKVRTCLVDSPSSSARSAPAELQQTVEQITPTPKQPVKKITSSNINQFGTRKSDAPQTGQLLQRQRQNQQTFSNHHITVDVKQAGTNSVQQPQVPTKSDTEPHVSNMVNNSPYDVSESMLAYMTAEQLAGHESLTDYDIFRAMNDSEYRKQLAASGRPIAPMSALSMEEHKLLQSLDRLNDKLRVVGDGSLSNRSQVDSQSQPLSPAHSKISPHNTAHNISICDTMLSAQGSSLQPHPPRRQSQAPRPFTTTARGFKGHRPLQNRQRVGSADSVRPVKSPTSGRQVRLY